MGDPFEDLKRPAYWQLGRQAPQGGFLFRPFADDAQLFPAQLDDPGQGLLLRGPARGRGHHAAVPGRPHQTDLLLCGHHYRVSRQALAAAGARVFRPDGTPLTAGDPADRPFVAPRG